MSKRELTRSFGWPMAVGLSLLLLTLGTLGCDRFDPSALLAAARDSSKELSSRQTTGTATTATTAGATAKTETRGGDMESIGPDNAMRIYYQFIDDRGRVQFVERLSDVPPAWRDQVGYVEMSQPPPLTPQQARQSWQLSERRANEIRLASASTSSSWGGGRSQNESVILYSATWCGYSTKARIHLDRAGIQYELRDVDNDAVSQELRNKTGRGGIPVLDFSGEILRGYSPSAYDKAIRKIRG